jgi:riboflavin synthase
MFTGLVADLGTVAQAQEQEQAQAEAPEAGARLRIQTRLGAELGPGDSVAVNGVCLTALDPGPDGFTADVVAETLRRSSLGALAAGDRVNLELPLRAADRLGGHVVLGHVDGLGVVTRADEATGELAVELEDPALLRYVVEKGSIALDGVSLTVAAVDDESLTVALIPETRRRTTLGHARPGTNVNVEVDVLAKHLEKLVAA